MKEWLFKLGLHLERHVLNTPVKHAPLLLAQKVCEAFGMNSVFEAFPTLSANVFITLEDLSSEAKSFAVQLSNHNQDYVGPTAHLGGAFDVKHLLLVGFLRADKLGNLSLNDGSRSVHCMLTAPKQAWLNQLVVLLHWHYIKSCEVDLDNSYIEVLSLAVIPFSPSSMGDRKFSSAGVERILSVPELLVAKLNARLVLHVKGAISARSPVHKSTGCSPFFFVQLRCPDSVSVTPIAVQGSSFTNWWHFLELHRIVLIKNLKYKKVTENGFHGKIWCTTADSTFSIVDDDDSETDSQRDSPLSSWSRAATSPCCKRLISYYGCITDVGLSQYGVFTLDDKLILIVAYHPWETRKAFRVGTWVDVSNAHVVAADNEAAILACCTLTTVKVANFSCSLLGKQEFPAPRHAVVSLCQGLSALKYWWIVQSMKAVEENVSTFIFKECSMSLSRALMDLLSKSQLCSDASRSVFKEFITVPHTCILEDSPLETSRPLPTVSTVSTLLCKVTDTVGSATCPGRSSTISWYHGLQFDRFHVVSEGGSSWTYCVLDLHDVSPNTIFVANLIKHEEGFCVEDFTSTMSAILSDDSSDALGMTWRALVLISRGQVVVERSQYMEYSKSLGSVKRKTWDQVYLILRKSDLVFLSSWTEAIHKVDVSVRKREKRLKLDADERVAPPGSENRSDATAASDRSGLCGIIVFRQYRKSANMPFDLERISDSHVYIPSLGICAITDLRRTSFGLFPFVNSSLQLKVQCSTTGQLVSLWFDSNKLTYKKGLLLGAEVEFENLRLVTGKSGKPYFRVASNSVYRLLKEPSCKHSETMRLMCRLVSVRKPLACTKRISLISHMQDRTAGRMLCADLCEVICRIVCIQWISAKWICCDCPKGMVDGRCSLGCSGTKVFHFDVRCVVDDGTAEAYLHVENEAACVVVGVSDEELDRLQVTCRSTGSLFVQRDYGANSSERPSKLSQRRRCEWSLQKRFTDSALSRYWLVQYTLFKKQTVSSDVRTTSILVRNTEYHSLTCPKLSLQAVGVYPVDYRCEIASLIP